MLPGNSVSFSLYIHWPFCRSLCPYCAFNRYVIPSIDWQEWTIAFTSEINYWANVMPGKKLESIFFGGGSPSIMQPELVRAIIQKAKDSWPVDSDLEITLEMNPTDVSFVPAFIDAGVNRISMGIQSFNEEVLQWLGRKHTILDIKEALTILKSSGLRYSFDLIYGHVFHKHLWQQELETTANWQGGHLSLYELSYEAKTPFYKKRHDGLDDESLLQIESQSEIFLNTIGLQRYEISNYSIPGDESRHNLMYWEYKEYIGVGPGAHGRVSLSSGKYAIQTHSLPNVWLDSIKMIGHGIKDQEFLPREQQICEHLLMGLRLSKGIHMKDVFFPTETPSDEFLERLSYCYENGLMHLNTLRLTSRGRCILMSVIAYLCDQPMIKKSL